MAQTQIELFKENSSQIDGVRPQEFFNNYNHAGLTGRSHGFSAPITIAANVLKLRDHLLKTKDMTAGIAAENRERHERAMAVQGATANLFQPYQVGKANVTAALGGYRGEHAVAVGTGYRFLMKTLLCVLRQHLTSATATPCTALV